MAATVAVPGRSLDGEVLAAAIAADPSTPSRLATVKNRAVWPSRSEVRSFFPSFEHPAAPVRHGVEDEVRCDPGEQCRPGSLLQQTADEHSGEDMVGDEHRSTLPEFCGLTDVTCSSGERAARSAVTAQLDGRRTMDPG